MDINYNSSLEIRKEVHNNDALNSFDLKTDTIFIKSEPTDIEDLKEDFLKYENTLSHNSELWHYKNDEQAKIIKDVMIKCEQIDPEFDIQSIKLEETDKIEKFEVIKVEDLKHEFEEPERLEERLKLEPSIQDEIFPDFPQNSDFKIAKYLGNDGHFVISNPSNSSLSAVSQRNPDDNSIVRVSDNQLDLLIKERSGSEHLKNNTFWKNAAKVLNDAGPCIKSPSRWSMWFNSFKNRLKKRLENGNALSLLEQKINLIEENISKANLKVSQKQLSILVEEKQKHPQRKKFFWRQVSKILNSEGPCIKTSTAWSKWFIDYKHILKKRIKKGDTLTELQMSILNAFTENNEIQVNANEKQLSMLIGEICNTADISTKTQEEKNFFWKILTKRLNDEGPCVKSSNEWRVWFSSYKVALKKKISSGIELTPLESMLRLPNEKKHRSLIKVSEKQLAMLIEEKIRFAHKNRYFWKDIAEVLNQEGPCIKSPSKWNKWFLEYRVNLKKRIKNGATPTPLQLSALHLLPDNTTPQVKVSNQQLLILLKEKNKNTLWSTISEILNNEGPCIKSASNWRMWFNFFKRKILKKVKKAETLTPLETMANLLEL